MKTIEQLLWRKAQLLKEKPILVHLQNQIDALLEGETQTEKCTILINICHQQNRLIQDSIKSIITDIEELEKLCLEYQSDYLN